MRPSGADRMKMCARDFNVRPSAEMWAQSGRRGQSAPLVSNTEPPSKF